MSRERAAVFEEDRTYKWLFFAKRSRMKFTAQNNHVVLNGTSERPFENVQKHPSRCRGENVLLADGKDPIVFAQVRQIDR